MDLQEDTEIVLLMFLNAFQSYLKYFFSKAFD